MGDSHLAVRDNQHSRAPRHARPATSGEVSGTVNAASVVAVTTQGIAVNDFAEVLRAIREGVAYANVHTVRSPGGEIRGQIRH